MYIYIYIYIYIHTYIHSSARANPCREGLSERDEQKIKKIQKEKENIKRNKIGKKKTSKENKINKRKQRKTTR